MKKIRKKVVREKAIIAIYQYVLIGTTEEEIIAYLNSDKNFGKDKEEYNYCKLFILTIIDYYDKYISKIEPLLKKNWSIDRISKMELAILLVATHELETAEIDHKIVINEAVELSKKYCDDDSYKFINGILNKLI